MFFLIEIFRSSSQPQQRTYRSVRSDALGILCPLTCAPFGHDHQRRHAEQHRLAPRDPAPAPPNRGRHPAGDRPGGVYHDANKRERVTPGDIILGIFPSPSPPPPPPPHPGYIRSLLLPLPALRQKYVTSPRGVKGASSPTAQCPHGCFLLPYTWTQLTSPPHVTSSPPLTASLNP